MPAFILLIARSARPTMPAPGVRSEPTRDARELKFSSARNLYVLRYLNLASRASAFSRAAFCLSVKFLRGAGVSFRTWYSIHPRQTWGARHRDWYIVAAKEYMSLRWCGLPVRDCSGAKHSHASSGCSAFACDSESLIHWVISKFASFGEPSAVRMMFAGLMSPWRWFWLWA